MPHPYAMKPMSFFRYAFTCFVCAFGMSTISFAADIGIKNGDFASGKQFWRGDGVVVTLPDGNKVIELTSSERRSSEISQEIEKGTLVALEVRFRARFIGGRGQMRAKLQKARGGSTLFAFDLPPEGEWRDFSFKHTPESLRDDRSLVLHTLPYEGKLQIDDVWVGEPGTHPSVRPMVTTSPSPAIPAPAPPAVPTPAPANAAGMKSPLEDSEWIWGSGGKLRLSSGGVARHTSWKQDGTWKLDAERKMILNRPGNVPPMTVIFDDLNYLNGEVTSHTGARTTIKRVAP